MQQEAAYIAPGVKRAALAFSALSASDADAVSRHLPARDRSKLRVGLVHVRHASPDEQRAALRALLRAVDRGPEWAIPELHDPQDCPFRCVDGHDQSTIARAFDIIAARRPLHVAVALCHLEPHERTALWPRLGPKTRGDVVVQLPDVPGVSAGRTRAFARELRANIERLEA